MNGRDMVAGHAFISYVREDSLRVDQLQRILEAAGVPVWRDTRNLWPGEDWRAQIRHAITDNALVFIACFSRNSLTRGRSFQNEELNLAIEQLRLRHPGESWFIPVRFDDCDIPAFEIGGGRTLASIHRADLFGDKSGEAAARLVAAIERILGKCPVPSTTISATESDGVEKTVDRSVRPIPATAAEDLPRRFTSDLPPRGSGPTQRAARSHPPSRFGDTSGILESKRPSGEPPSLLQEAGVDSPRPARDHRSTTTPTSEGSPSRARRAKKPRTALVIAATAALVTILVTAIVYVIQPPSEYAGSGTLNGGFSLAPRTVNLSAEGTSDWIHWGYLPGDDGNSQFIGHPARQDCPSDGSCTDHMQGSGPRIGDFTPTGSYDKAKLPFRLYVPDALATFSWDNGFPVRAVTGARTQDYIAGVGNGFRIQVPAGQATRIFRLYVGVWNGRIKCTAVLSDHSATAFTGITPQSSNDIYVYEFTYRSSSRNQTLTVNIVITDDLGGGNASMIAATLR